MGELTQKLAGGDRWTSWSLLAGFHGNVDLTLFVSDIANPTYAPTAHTTLTAQNLCAHVCPYLFMASCALLHVPGNAHSPRRQQRVHTLHGHTNTPASARMERHLVSLTSPSPSPVQLACKTQGVSPVFLICIASVHRVQRVINLPLKICKVGARTRREKKIYI